MNRNLAKVFLKPLNHVIIRRKSTFNSLIDVSEEVSAAFRSRHPVVALESTIITHGMPYPHNLTTATRVEEIIRNQGAVPATIAIIRGRIKVGLDNVSLSELAEMKEPAVKTSRRDFPHVLSNRFNGGTTVSGTIVVADLVGIQVFVTGGIGGVHRGGETSLDVSADLNELGRNSVAVVSSGVKSILDIGKTLEYLETQGVCVATYGPTRAFPAFYTRQSGFNAPYNASSPRQAAEMINSLQALGLKSGFLLAVPIPTEHAIGGDNGEDVMEAVILKALKEAEENGIVGKELTPFLLSRVGILTDGKSLTANIALIENNAKVGAQVAVELHKLQNKESSKRKLLKLKETSATWDTKTSTPQSPVVVGGSVLDCVIAVDEDNIKLDGSTHQGRIGQSGGGVGRNIADALGKLGNSPLLISSVGEDQYGSFLLQHTLQHVDCSGVQVLTNERTACYNVVLDRGGECKLGVGDMEIHSTITPSYVSQFAEQLRQCPLVVVDGNIPTETISYILELCAQAAVPVWYEPTDVKKASKPFQNELWKSLKFISPNFNELKMMAKATGFTANPVSSVAETVLDDLLNEVASLCQHLVKYGNTAVVTLGSRGVMIVRNGQHDEPFFIDGKFVADTSANITARYYPVKSISSFANVSGAGDCFASGFITAMLRGETESECVFSGSTASLQALHSISAVPRKMSTHCQTSSTFHSVL